jgi:hypothetical protein
MTSSVKEALAVDAKSGTTFWKDAFEFQDDDKMPIGSLKTKYTLKNNSVAEPAVYLGAKVSKHYIAESDDPDKPRWSLSAEDYVKRAVKDVETEDAQASYYAGLIGVLRWCIELGRIDIMIEVSLLSRFLANPREGHLQQALHIFGYLKKHERSKTRSRSLTSAASTRLIGASSTRRRLNQCRRTCPRRGDDQLPPHALLTRIMPVAGLLGAPTRGCSSLSTTRRFSGSPSDRTPSNPLPLGRSTWLCVRRST